MLSLQLKSAATDGETSKLVMLLQNVDPVERDEENFTPLHYAAWGGVTSTVDRLLEFKGVDVNAKNQSGQTPLHLAAGFGRYETVERLLMAGALVNARDNVGYTPLHASAEGQWGVTGWEGTGGRETRHADVVRLLLQSGADASVQDSFNRTPLDVSADNKTIRQLLQSAQVNAMKQHRRTVEGNPSSSLPTALGIESWDRNAVSIWLRQIGLGQYESIFLEKGINGKYLLTRMTPEKAGKLITDEFHSEIFIDALNELKATHMKISSEGANQDRQTTMPSRSMFTGARSQITFDNPTNQDVRVYQLDDAGQNHLKRILSPFQTISEDTVEGTVFYLCDDKTGARLGWVQVLARPTLIHVPEVAIEDGDGMMPMEILPPAYTDN